MLLGTINLRRVTIALLLVGWLIAAPRDRIPPQPAVDLIREVVTNELTDRAQDRRWMYLIDKREDTQTLTEEQVDTQDGPFYRLLAVNGTPLNPDQRQQDNARMDRLLHDPGKQLKIKQGHDEDEQKLDNLMRMMPEAFLYDYDGAEGGLVRLAFRPNPDYKPPTYEARVAHSLSGSILIDPLQKRLAKFSGQLIDRVQFGFGFFGHIDKGGTMEIRRVPVGPLQWKTTLVNIQLSGRLVFFKTVSKQQYETRSDFSRVANDLSLPEANKLLIAYPASVPTSETRHRVTEVAPVH